MKYTFLIFAAALAVASCKKEKSNEDTPSVSDGAYVMPSTIGSYWVYEWSQVDSSGNVTPMNITDMVQITGTVFMNGHTYVKYEGNMMGNPTSWIHRDSSDCIVNPEGTIIYSTQSGAFLMEYDFSNIFHRLFKMGNPTTFTYNGSQISVLDKQEVVSNLDGTPINPCGMTQTFHNYFASGIGEVRYETAYVSSLQGNCGILQRNLVNYHIAP